MKIRLLQYFLVAAVFLTAYAGAFLEKFDARSEGENVRLEWRTSNEANLKRYVIERKSSQSPFIEIASVEPKGNSLYVYTDETAYKTNDNLIFTYRLKIIENNDSFAYSAEVSVVPNVSDVKRTWGSIKAMFR